ADLCSAAATSAIRSASLGGIETCPSRKNPVLNQFGCRRIFTVLEDEGGQHPDSAFERPNGCSVVKPGPKFRQISRSHIVASQGVFGLPYPIVGQDAIGVNCE